MSSVSIDGAGTQILDDFEEFYRNYYENAIAELAQGYPSDQKSLYVEAADVLDYDPDLLYDWRESPGQIQSYAEEALRQHDLPASVDLANAHVRLTDSEGILETHAVTDVASDDIGDYVAISGQLSRITGKKPRLATAVYECQRCGTTTEIPQGRNEVQEVHECQGCERQGPFTLATERSEWVDQRKIKLEEPIEDRTQPRGEDIPVYIEDDLCEYGPGATTLPDHAGEKATILGVVRVDESTLNGRNADPESDHWIDARAIVFDVDAEEDIDVDAHRETFEDLATGDDAVERVAESLAPALHADEGDDLYTVRRACAAWLFNAYRIDPDGAGSKRGDLHMCLIGDPGVGKSTLMGYLNDVLPKSEYRTGTGLSEVGLTAAAVQEEFAGKSEWTLQPGILPRADGGHCIIDEIDGVIDEKTKAIHDALEGEQMVKADKAGIQADLPSRCALLVGGNPTHTRFDSNEPITEQIDLDPALFDRMDLVFAMEDIVDEDHDRTKAHHALGAWDELAEAQTGEKDVEDAETTNPPVPKETLRAWVKYARDNVFPTLTTEAKDHLEDFYVEVRDLNDGHDGNEGAVPATMRTLEGSIRLAIAFARLRLSETVEIQDAKRAIDLTKEVVGLRFDPETGEFDVQRVTSGEPKSQQVRRKQLPRIIDRLAGDEPAQPDEVVETATEELRTDADTIEDDLEHLKQKNVIYEPDGEGNGYRRV